jgi:hypothetical protein
LTVLRAALFGRISACCTVLFYDELTGSFGASVQTEPALPPADLPLLTVPELPCLSPTLRIFFSGAKLNRGGSCYVRETK